MSELLALESTSENQQDLLASYLDTFTSLVNEQSQTSQDELAYPWAWRHVGGESDFHLVVSIMIHGNEVGPLEGLLDVIDGLLSGKIKFMGTFTCFIGNPEAARLNKRFIDIDLNRVFERTVLTEPPKKENSKQTLETDLSVEVAIPHEVSRAQTLMDLLDQADLYIDFHQTILDSTQSFYICPWSKITWQWMRIMGGAKVWVTRDPKHNSGGFKCADEYVRQRGIPSIALELGVLGFSARARAGVWKSLNRAFKSINRLKETDLTLDNLAEGEPDLTFYRTSFRAPFSNARLCLTDGLVNFQPVTQGQVLSDEKEGELLIVAPESGVILFPKYPTRNDEGVAKNPLPKELYRIVVELEEHPLTLWE